MKYSSILTPVLFMRSASTPSTEERVVFCKRPHPPLSIPLSSVTSSKISKHVDFSEMSVIIRVVLGGYETENRKLEAGLDLREIG